MPRQSNLRLDLDEQSPLLPRDSNTSESHVRETGVANDGQSAVKTKSTLQLILLVLGICGLQFTWSVELSNGSPYLLSLGMTKALMAFVWLAGPLTGVLVQPVVGVLSDQCQLKLGRRRPFMIGGALATVATSIILSYAREIVFLFGRWPKDTEYAGTWKAATIAFATVLMWLLDFAINTLQAAIRAFIVDGAPPHQQSAANSWASRVVGLGNVLGYVFGYLNLPRYCAFFGNTQFKVLCVIGSIVLCLTVFISCATISERDPREDPLPEGDQGGIISFFRTIFLSATRLTPRVREICQIQFCHWLAYFPFLFYTTTYIGQLYVDPRLGPNMTDDEIDALWAAGTRVGTLALLIYAVVAFVSNIVLPFLVVPVYQSTRSRQILAVTPTSPLGTRHSYDEAILDEGSTNQYDNQGNEPNPSPYRRALNKLRIPGLTLRRAWIASQILHAICMFSTFFITTPLQSTIMVSFMGITWALTLWAPFAFISSDIAHHAELRRKKNKIQQRIMRDPNTSESGVSSKLNKLEKIDEQEDRAGIILGLHNVAISAPQVIATLISSVIFKVLQKDRRTPGDCSIAWALRIGGLAALGAAYLTWRMSEKTDELDEVVDE